MFAIAALSTHAQIVQTNYSSETESLPNGVTLSTTDLLQTSLASASRTGASGSGNTYFYREDSGYTVDISRLYDGDFGTFGSSGLGGDGHYTVMPNNVTITFTFDLTTNTAGYDLSAIRTFASWDDGRDGQSYQVQYSTASAPSTFNSLYTIASYNPSFVTGDPANTVVQLTASSGSLATNVAALRFVFTGFENGGTAYREFDVVGAAAVPEPSTYAALLGLGALGAALVRRRRDAGNAGR